MSGSCWRQLIGLFVAMSIGFVETVKTRKTSCVSIYDRKMPQDLLTRRSFLGKATASSLLGAVKGSSAFAQTKTSTYFELFRSPDRVAVYAVLDRRIDLAKSGSRWHAPGVEVETSSGAANLQIHVSTANTALTHVHVRWNVAVDSRLRFLGDHWERSYGDLSWRAMTPERVLPWYFATYDGAALHAYGVEAGAGAMCFWQL